MKICVNRIARDFDANSSFALRALRPIKKGEEVTISYGEGDLTSLDLLGESRYSYIYACILELAQRTDCRH